MAKKSIKEEIREILAEDFVGPPLPEEYLSPNTGKPLFMTGPPLGARVDPKTNRGDFVRDKGHPRYSPVEEQMHPAAGYYGETSRDDIIRARQSRPVSTIESGYDPVHLLDPEPQQDFRHRMPVRQFVPGHQRTPELMSSQFYPPPTISNEEQEIIDSGKDDLSRAIMKALQESKKGDK